jgi:3-oxoadipate enol-lactonase
MPSAQLPDGRIHYQLEGRTDLPVLVFSNSLGTSLEMWAPQVGPFSEHFRLLRYDPRGHGRSAVTPGDYSIEQLATDLLQLLDSLELGRVYFCGLSMGGAIGIHLGSHAPERFYKLVVCNTAAKFGTAETWNTRMQAVQAGGTKAVAGSVIERWFTSGFRASHPLETQTTQAMLEAASPQGYLSCCAAVRDVDLRRSLGNVRVPCLVLTGTEDPVTPPAEARYLVDHIPQAQYAEVPAAHLSNIEARDDFNRQVLGFLLSGRSDRWTN